MQPSCEIMMVTCVIVIWTLWPCNLILHKNLNVQFVSFQKINTLWYFVSELKLLLGNAKSHWFPDIYPEETREKEISFNYGPVYGNLKCWKKTAHHLWPTVHPVQVLVYDIFDQFFLCFSKALQPWWLCPFCKHVECNHQKKIYQKCYPGIIEASSQHEACYSAFVPANESFTCI